VTSILTAAELEASLRVLRRLRAAQSATVILTWSPEEQRAYGRLERAGYVENLERPWSAKLSAPFRWDRIAATAAGREYLRQIETTQRKES
jgi:hypothetical protein